MVRNRRQVENLHSVASHSIGDHASFSAPAFSRCVVENDTRLSVTYAVIKHAPEVAVADRERTVWIMKQTLSGPRIMKDEKKTVVVRIFKVFGFVLHGGIRCCVDTRTARAYMWCS